MRSNWSREREPTHRVISIGEGGFAAGVGELEMLHQRSQDCAQLHIGELLTNAAMTASTEWQVRTVCALGDQTISIIDLLLIFVLGKFGLVPTVGVPLEGLGEELGRTSSHTGRRQHVVSGRDHKVGSFHGHGVLDGADDGVNGSVDTQGLLDDLGVQIQLVEALMGEGRKIRAQHLELFLVKLLYQLGAGGQTQNDPGSG